MYVNVNVKFIQILRVNIHVHPILQVISKSFHHPIPSPIHLVSISKRSFSSDPFMAPATSSMASVVPWVTVAAAKSVELTPAICTTSAALCAALLESSGSRRLREPPDPPHKRWPEGSGSRKRTWKFSKWWRMVKRKWESWGGSNSCSRWELMVMQRCMMMSSTVHKNLQIPHTHKTAIIGAAVTGPESRLFLPLLNPRDALWCYAVKHGRRTNQDGSKVCDVVCGTAFHFTSW